MFLFVFYPHFKVFNSFSNLFKTSEGFPSDLSQNAVFERNLFDERPKYEYVHASLNVNVAQLYPVR